MDTQKIYSSFRGFRRKRMDLFISQCRPAAETTILDVGGFSGFWKDSGVPAQITILRLDGAEILPAGTPANIRSIVGDGCDLCDHADKSYDIVFSNSVIEHVGGVLIKWHSRARRCGSDAEFGLRRRLGSSRWNLMY